MSGTFLSMTGFGRASASLGTRTVSVEVRALNHRGLDVKVRSHELRLAPEIETGILRMVRGRLVRGSVAVNVSEAPREGGTQVDLDVARARGIHATLEGLRKELGLASPVDLATVAAFVNAGSAAPPAELPAACWPALAPALAAALDGLLVMRAQEGAAILADVTGRLTNLRGLVERIATLATGVPDRAARRLEERLAVLAAATPAIEPARLAHEVAVLAERLDVSEEIARLRAHLEHLGVLLAGQAKDAPGRRIDFLAQEIAREFNTLGGKIQDAAIAALVIDGKAELEKLREQAQNIE
ncbi:MAG: DUF1732 domain-containing protein [Deltaproteobacteria bacterium]|jgi:uncharacterized protein (TIGR00255 family)|nr:DUF1732 domain-containing protein [Deltaproteobacteria bacterium]